MLAIATDTTESQMYDPCPDDPEYPGTYRADGVHLVEGHEFLVSAPYRHKTRRLVLTDVIRVLADAIASPVGTEHGLYVELEPCDNSSETTYIPFATFRTELSQPTGAISRQ
jgi:hypothetical protein